MQNGKKEIVLSFHINNCGEVQVRVDGQQITCFKSLHLDIINDIDGRINGRLYFYDTPLGWGDGNTIKQIPGINAFISPAEKK